VEELPEDARSRQCSSRVFCRATRGCIFGLAAPAPACLGAGDV
jgi:hypothetical protein